jgi:hypothetical protein
VQEKDFIYWVTITYDEDIVDAYFSEDLNNLDYSSKQLKKREGHVLRCCNT